MFSFDLICGSGRGYRLSLNDAAHPHDGAFAAGQKGPWLWEVSSSEIIFLHFRLFGSVAAPTILMTTWGRSSIDHRSGFFFFFWRGGLSHPTCVEAEEAGSVNRWVRLWWECAHHGCCGQAATASRTFKSDLR